MPPKKKEDDQNLPQKEKALFKQLVKQYENRQLKAALKTANTILKKFPDHGETISMKGLTLGGMDGRKEEAYELVKLGLEKNAKSHVCWHVSGLLHRQDKNYKQAIKCYQNALNIDTENQQIMRDLALLQKTRHRLLELKPSQKQHWIGFAVAQHLNKDYETALKIIDSMEDSMEPPETKWEASEIVLYRSMILFESGNYAAILKLLEDKRDTVLDKLAWWETKAKCFVALNQMEEAQQAYLNLFKENPENRNFLLGYVQTAGFAINSWTEKIPVAHRDGIVKLLTELTTQVPKSHAVERVLLDVSYGDVFVDRLSAFVKLYLRRTIPSLFSALKSLYFDSEKVALMTKLFVSWEASLKNNKFPDEDVVESPSTYLWMLMLKSAHLYRQEQYQGALEAIEQAIEHTPTVEMIYILKGRILKHLGKREEAWAAVDKARLLDTADRYLNNRAAKYHLRNNKVKEAEQTASLFIASHDDTPACNTLVDMQCMWYEIEEGDAFHRMGDVITAMKKWLLVDKHFLDIEEDQFDFHSYCLRKCTLRAYIDLLRFQRRSHGHKFYFRAAVRIVRGYLEIFDALEKGDDLHAKVIGKKKDEANPADETQKASKGKSKGKARVKDSDDEDEEDTEARAAAKAQEYNMHVATEDPLGAADRFVDSLQRFHPGLAETHILASELYLRQKKPLLVLKCLTAGFKIDPTSDALKNVRGRLEEQVKSAELPQALKAAVTSQLLKLAV
eukprot:TRINITY_DN9868_c0_g1_i1.p1 TRINITY_DN9868_c0_g1~~TRINITY_DN9868_c0_g1_i1.p1  ORF type:complete len:733 (-),score=143.41 TRINITY_DN9868_c0_g1_i1:72-2270(-)